ncbi:hypothetical protein GGF37_002021 [Kickxella alabastrina]|nr:hypothetical protein GGF37_002021 [Kickxella alabastrina]
MKPGRALHSDIQREISEIDDLVPLKFQAQWEASSSDFINNRILDEHITDTPDIYFSPSTQQMLSFWQFNSSDKFPSTKPVQETTLLTLLDNTGAELVLHMMSLTPRAKTHLGFTVNLNVARKGFSPAARLFYFKLQVVYDANCKFVLKCPIYDAETAKLLLVARMIFVFVPMAKMPKQIEVAKASSSDNSQIRLPQIDAPDVQALDNNNLLALSQVMNCLPLGIADHKAGLLSMAQRRMAAIIDFGENIAGPKYYIHGGVLATVLCNASSFLLTKITGVSMMHVATTIWNINYRKGIRVASKGVVVDAVVEEPNSKGEIIIVTKLVNGNDICTTLETTVTLPKLNTKL